MLCANIDAALAQLVVAVSEFDERGGWSRQYAASFPQWLSWRSNVAPHFAKDMLSVAHALEDLPVVRQAFLDGKLTYWQARTICRVARADTQDTLVYLAAHCTAAQLQRICGAYGRVERSNAPSHEQREERALGYHYDDDGFMEIYARLCPEDAAILAEAIEATSERLRKEQEDETVTTRSSGQRQADALVEIARISLSSDDAGSVSPSHEVMVHVDLDTLVTGDGRCHIDDGPALAPNVVEKILCDSFVTTAVERDGAVIDVSPRRRTATGRQKKALLARAQMCVFPGCTYRNFLEAHHIKFYTPDEGETTLDNLDLLCWFHHDLVHGGVVSMTRDRDARIVFHDREGNVIERVPPKEPGSVEVLIRDNAGNGLVLTSETPKSGWDGGPVNLALCVDAIYSGAGPPERGS